jgi:hypothetical protein
MGAAAARAVPGQFVVPLGARQLSSLASTVFRRASPLRRAVAVLAGVGPNDVVTFELERRYV